MRNMLRATPARAAAAVAAAAARRFQSAHAAQAGWQQMVKQAQEQSIKGTASHTASVVATSRGVEAADRNPAQPDNLLLLLLLRIFHLLLLLLLLLFKRLWGGLDAALEGI